MSAHASCDWCGRSPAQPITLERAVYSGSRLLRRAIIAQACADHERFGLGPDEENATLPANTVRRRKDRDAIQLDLFDADEHKRTGGAYRDAR